MTNNSLKLELEEVELGDYKMTKCAGIDLCGPLNRSLPTNNSKTSGAYQIGADFSRLSMSSLHFGRSGRRILAAAFAIVLLLGGGTAQAATCSVPTMAHPTIQSA